MRALPALAALVAITVACSDSVTPPSDPSFELVNPAERLTTVNSHVYGSFAVAAGGGVILSGPANFPGHPPAGPGTCKNGLWINAQGKPTSGTATKPHPHCFSPSAAIEVVLEPISACYSGAQDEVVEPAQPPAEEPTGAEPAAEPAGEATPAEPPKGTKTCPAIKAVKGATVTQLLVRQAGSDPTTGTPWTEASVTSTDFSDPATPDVTEAAGIITGYAIDASTLGTTNKRVGTLRIELGVYKSLSLAYIHLNNAAGCRIDETIESPCLNLSIKATYNPLPAPNGIGPVDTNVEGFLWVTPANSPYNYTD